MRATTGCTLAFAIFGTAPWPTSAFMGPSSPTRVTLTDARGTLLRFETPAKHAFSELPGQISPLRAAASDGGEEADGGWRFNPPFALAWVGFLAFAYARTVGEAPGASQEVLNQFLMDPIHPGVNEIFAVVFNLLGLAPVVLASLIMPSARGQKLPATPFLALSAAAGYTAVGPYMAFRQPAVDVAVKSDLGWFTANVLENKAFNWLVAGSAFSTLFVTGFAQAVLTDPGQAVHGYIDLLSDTAIASASSLDLVILSVTAASLVPEDLERRGMQDTGKANVIAASTLLLPVVGGAIYCALRPSLPEE
mmetsp:Transcript_903/g.2595  ORF Transcript_903/g.2595 Transcript_903/m.2595 type:complete len:307 (-) Transcript_903:346-1266(-)